MIIVILLYSAAPVITHEDKLKEDIVLKAGASLNIQVEVKGIPDPTLSWKHEGSTLSQSGNVSIERKNGFGNLSIKGTKGTDKGTYTVLAENAVGTATAEFKVTVIGESS